MVVVRARGFCGPPPRKAPILLPGRSEANDDLRGLIESVAIVHTDVTLFVGKIHSRPAATRRCSIGWKNSNIKTTGTSAVTK